MAKTLYEILNVGESASEQELHQAFKLQEQYLLGLDTLESAGKLNCLRDAFLKLSDSAQRLAYDRKLAGLRIAASKSIAGPDHGWSAWLGKPSSLAALVALCALLVFWNIENKKIQLAENQRLTEQQALLAKQQQAALQDETEKLNHLSVAEQQAELENKRLEMQDSLLRQVNNNDQDLSLREIANQEMQSRRSLDLAEKRANMEFRGQEIDLAEKQLDLQSKKLALSREQKQQSEQHAALMRQRALQQLDANIQSIRDLQAARLRDYDRNHYGTGGITVSNPGYSENPSLMSRQ